MKKIRTQILLVAARAFFFTVASVPAATITVNSSADSGGTCPGADCTLRQALATAAPAGGDIINFAPGITTINLTTNYLGINRPLTIIGPGANLLTIQRNSRAIFRIFEIGTDVVAISGLTLANGSAPDAFSGGIFNDGTLTLTDCAITGNTGGSTSGNNGAGGGIYNNNVLTLNNCTVSGNSGGWMGGGVYNENGATATNTSSTISGNFASNGGGIASFGTAVTITSSTIAGNSAQDASGKGGGILNLGSTINVMNTIVAKNTAANGPDVSGALTSKGYNLVGNNSGANIVPAIGDRVGAAGSPIDPKLGPLQDNGGPTKTQALLSGSPAIDRGKYSGSSTDQRGYTRPVDISTYGNAKDGDGNDIGAYEVQANDLPPSCNAVIPVVMNNNGGGTGSLRDVIAGVCAGSTITFAANVRGAIDLTGPEILISKSLTINGPGANLLSVQRSASASTDFRIFNIADHSTVAISGLTIANGHVPGNFGGGIYNNNSELTLANVTISGNTADFGAGLYTGRAATITNSTISNNTVSGNLAGDGGGGIYNQGGTLSLTNSTISSNTAHIGNGGAQGGAIRNNLGTVTIASSTIVENVADQGGGIYHNNTGVVTLQNSIIAQNTSANGPDLNGTFSSNGFNLIGNVAGGSITPKQGDKFGITVTELKLGPLQDNGGPTPTHALLAGSVALDRGNSGGLALDQRGLVRPSNNPAIANAAGGDGSDIGAFELQVPPPSPTPTPTATATPTATPKSTATPTASPKPGSLGNISTRLQVLTGNNVLFAGFIIQGSASKTVLIRSAGPSLAAFGLPGAMSNPRLELHNASSTIGTNDNWQTTQLGGVITSSIKSRRSRTAAQRRQIRRNRPSSQRFPPGATPQSCRA